MDPSILHPRHEDAEDPEAEDVVLGGERPEVNQEEAPEEVAVDEDVVVEQEEGEEEDSDRALFPTMMTRTLDVPSHSRIFPAPSLPTRISGSCSKTKDWRGT